MKQSRTSCFRNGAIKRSVAGLLLLLWLNVLALAALPNLHTHAHHDAHQADHQCVVTAVTHGNFHFSGPALIGVEPVRTIQIEPANFASVILPAISHRLAPGRAPPTA